MRRFGLYMGVAGGIILLFTLLLTGAYLIPDKAIEWHREYSLTVLAIEEEYETWGNIYGMNSEPGMLDNTTDRVMMQLALPSDTEMSPLQKAMHMNGYARYWHGYQVVLRPLLVFYQYHQIRYLNQLLFFGLFVMTLAFVNRRLGRMAALAFFMSMGCSLITAIPSSMQFMAAYIIMMAVSILLLIKYPFKRFESMPLLFMVTGMLVNYFDLLTVPLVTLGIPLILSMMMEAQRGDHSGKACLKLAFYCTLAWMLGYAMCWISKWVISSVVLKSNVFEQAFGQAALWTQAEQANHARTDGLIQNFHDYFTCQGKRTMIVVFAPLVFCGMLALCFPKRKNWSSAALIGAVSLYPYVWYLVLAQHSWQHHWFTFRAQCMTLMGVYAALLVAVDWARVKTVFSVRSVIRKG